MNFCQKKKNFLSSKNWRFEILRLSEFIYTILGNVWVWKVKNMLKRSEMFRLITEDFYENTWDSWFSNKNFNVF